MAREMYLVGVSEDELKKTDPETPKTPKKKWENFWSQIAITSWTRRGKNLGHGWSRRIYP